MITNVIVLHYMLFVEQQHQEDYFTELAGF